VLSVCLVVVAAVGTATAQARQTTLVPTGSIRIAWHGDPAHGCEAAGVCGYSGTVTLTPGEGTAYSLSNLYSADLELANDPVVRVVRLEGDAIAGTCTDRLAVDLMELELERLPGGRVQPHPTFFPGVSGGRCAGPPLDAAVVGLRLPTFRPRGLAGRVIDLSGTNHAAAGAFAVDVVSTVRVRVAVAPAEPDVFGTNFASQQGRPLVTRRRVVALDVLFDLRRFSGQTQVAFDGLPGPRCLPLDSCGLSGSLKYAFDVRNRSLYVRAWAPVSRSARHPRRLALRALRAGRARVDGTSQLDEAPRNGATISAGVARGGAPECVDSSKVAISPLAVAGRGRTLRMVLGGPSTGYLPGLVDTSCPAPVEWDVLGEGPIARAGLAPAALLRRSVRVELTRAGSLAAPGYAGTTVSRYIVHLRRRALHARFETVETLHG
jgi:hypothetical protein